MTFWCKYDKIKRVLYEGVCPMAAGNRKSSNKRKTQTKKERMAEMEKAQAFRVEVTLWIVVAAALLLFISNLGFGGAVGKTVSGFLFGMFGLMAYVLPVLLLVGSFFAVSNRGNKLAAVKLIAAIVFLVFLCTFMGLAMNGNDRIHPLDAYTYCEIGRASCRERVYVLV